MKNDEQPIRDSVPWKSRCTKDPPLPSSYSLMLIWWGWFWLDGDDDHRSYYLVVRVPPQPPSCHPLMPPSSDFSAYWWLARDVDGFYTPLPSNLHDSQFSHVNLRNLHLGIVYSSQIFLVWRFLKAFPRWWRHAIKVMWFMDSSARTFLAWRWPKARGNSLINDITDWHNAMLKNNM